MVLHKAPYVRQSSAKQRALRKVIEEVKKGSLKCIKTARLRHFILFLRRCGIDYDVRYVWD
jgi:hypothetical protein